MTRKLTSTYGKPVLDERTFQQLLAAAYTLQEHNDRLLMMEHKAELAPQYDSVIPPETAYQLSVIASQLEALTQPQIRSASEWTTPQLPAVAHETQVGEQPGHWLLHTSSGTVGS